MLLFNSWEGYLPVPVVPASRFLLRVFIDPSKKKGGDAMTEDLFYIFFLLWNLTDGFNPPYVESIIASAYIRFFVRYK